MQQTIRLDPGSTKNDDGRVVYLTPDVKQLLTKQLARVDALQKHLGRIIPWVFPHLGGAPGQQPGHRLITFAAPGARPVARPEFRGIS